MKENEIRISFMSDAWYDFDRGRWIADSSHELIAYVNRHKLIVLNPDCFRFKSEFWNHS